MRSPQTHNRNTDAAGRAPNVNIPHANPQPQIVWAAAAQANAAAKPAVQSPHITTGWAKMLDPVEGVRGARRQAAAWLGARATTPRLNRWAQVYDARSTQ
ncbi:hypothetical protein GCM10023263_49110 [Phytohabitans rumicis]